MIDLRKLVPQASILRFSAVFRMPEGYYDTGFVSDRLGERRYLGVQKLVAPPAPKRAETAAKHQLHHRYVMYPACTPAPPVPFFPFRTTCHGAVEILPVQKFC